MAKASVNEPVAQPPRVPLRPEEMLRVGLQLVLMGALFLFFRPGRQAGPAQAKPT